MREIAVKLYTLEELSDKAQERAHDAYLNGYVYYAWLDEIYNSAKVCLALLNCTVDVDSYDRFHASPEEWHTDAQALVGERAYAYIINRYPLKDEKGNDFLPTGYCSDYILLEAIASFKNKLRTNSKLTLADFLSDVCIRYTDEYQQEIETQNSFGYFAEMQEGTWYFEDGTIYDEHQAV